MFAQPVPEVSHFVLEKLRVAGGVDDRRARTKAE